LIESEKLFGGSSSKGINAFDTKERVMELNNVKIKAFPSHHLAVADFFPPGQQQDARDVSERYIAKSNPYIVMFSTPNAPDTLRKDRERS
jgi:hypothetical protein